MSRRRRHHAPDTRLPREDPVPAPRTIGLLQNARVDADERRVQLILCAEAVAAVAEFRSIAPRMTAAVKEDVEVRPLLETVVRRWSRLVKPTFVSAGGAGTIVKTDLEHIVPCRVLVDRMIMDPASCGELLRESVVLAMVTKDEHRALGGIFTHHVRLYEKMLLAPIAELPTLGLDRYSGSGIILTKL